MKQRFFSIFLIVVLINALTACAGEKTVKASLDENALVLGMIYDRTGMIKESIEEGEGVNVHTFTKAREWESKKYDNPISYAFATGGFETVYYLLEQGALLEEVNLSGKNAGALLAGFGIRAQFEYLDMLIQYDYDLNAESENGWTALDYIFAQEGDVFDGIVWELAEIMLEHEAVITSNTVAASFESYNGNANLPRLVRCLLENNQETGLDEIYESVILSESEKVRELWKKQKGKLSDEEKDKLGALVAAYCDLETLKIILEDVECDNGTVRWFMQAACRAGNLENVKYIVDNYHPSEENMSISVQSAMVQAEINRHYDVVEYLIEQGYEIPDESKYQARGWESLKAIAVINKDRERLDYLLSNNIGETKAFEELLRAAMNVNDIDTYKYLLDYATEKGIEISTRELIFAISNSTSCKDESGAEIMRYTLTKVPEMTQEEKDDALQDGIEYGTPWAVRILLEAGANPNAEGVPYAAVYKDDIEKIKLLVEYGMDVNTVHYGMGLLETSAMYSNEVMHYLHDQGAELTEESCNTSALIMAINAGRVRNAKDLIDMGIDLNIKNKDGRTAYDMAILSGRQELIDVFSGLEVSETE